MMEPLRALALMALLIALVLGPSGCMNDRTQNMTRTCKSLLEQDDTSSDKRFIRDAEEQLESLKQPENRVTDAVRDLRDRNAMAYKAELEQCLWMLKSRRP